MSAENLPVQTPALDPSVEHGPHPTISNEQLTQIGVTDPARQIAFRSLHEISNKKAALINANYPVRPMGENGIVLDALSAQYDQEMASWNVAKPAQEPSVSPQSSSERPVLDIRAPIVKHH